MNFPYAVVQFLREGTYSEIPTSWLSKDFTQCRWPTTKNVTFFIKKNILPETDWSLLNVRIECHCETLEKAQKIAEDANYAISCEETRKRKRIIYKKKFDDMYDTRDDSEDDDDDLLPQYKIPHKQLKMHKSQDSSEKKSLCDKQFLLKKQSSYEKVSHIAAKESFSTPNSSLHDKSSIQINSLQTNNLNNSNELLGFLPTQINGQNLDFISTTSPLSMVDSIGKLMPICIQTLNYVKSIDQKLKALEESIIDIKEPTNDIPFDDVLPINSIENLKKFEEKLENTTARMHWVQFVKKIRGKNSKNLIHQCMSRLFTNEFGQSCSWRGRRNNYRICDLKCICILKNVLKAKGVEESVFENIASEWLRFSKIRNERQTKKVLPDDNVQTDSSLNESEPKFLYAEVFCKDEEIDDTCTDQELTQE